MFSVYLWDEPPRLTLILGDRDSGKSNLGLLIGEILLDDFGDESRVDNVYVIIPVDDPKGEFFRKEEDQRFIASLTRLEKNIQRLRKAYILLDEGLIGLNARDRRKKINTMLVKVTAVSRHRQLYMSITTQVHRIDIQMRELADAIVIKRTSPARLLVLDKVPKRILLVNKALRKAENKEIGELDKREAARIGIPKTTFITGIPRAKHWYILDKRAKDFDIKL